MDPRGIGLEHAGPVRPGRLQPPVSLFPRTAGAVRAALAYYARALGRSCRRRTGPLLGHVDTLSVARDMEALRRALGDGKLNFLGLSYGAEIGTLYAELYPKRIRAMALDGILDHSVSIEASFADAARRLRGHVRPLRRLVRADAPTARCTGATSAPCSTTSSRRADQRADPRPGLSSGAVPARGHGRRHPAQRVHPAALQEAAAPAFGVARLERPRAALARAEQGDASAFATPLATEPASDGTFAGWP